MISRGKKEGKEKKRKKRKKRRKKENLKRKEKGKHNKGWTKGKWEANNNYFVVTFLEVFQIRDGKDFMFDRTIYSIHPCKT